jgi:hypothetical protein
MTAWRANAVDATRGGPTRDRLRVDAKQTGYLPWGQQPIPGLHHDNPLNCAPHGAAHPL